VGNNKLVKEALKVICKDAHPGTLAYFLEPFIDYQRVRHFTEGTVTTYENNLLHFMHWARDRGVELAEDVSRHLLEQYQRHLFYLKKKNGQPLSIVTQQSRLISLRVFFKWLARKWHIPVNPASELELPRTPQTLPRHTLTAQEAEKILSVPDITDVRGLRDRAILELLYSSGLRRSEVVHLKLFDLSFESGTVFVRNGKGKKDRMVPVGDRCLKWIDKYLRESRPKLCYGLDEGYLFITHRGGNISSSFLGKLVFDYVKTSDVGKPGACHLFRHTMATLMLEGGADVRYIQAILGHSKLTTTEIYTHVSIHKLKAVHEMSHPARWKKDPPLVDPPPEQ
jgi:integrase/recombinase XerD